MKKKKVNVVFLLDRSGSMGGCVEDTIGGYNQYLKEQRESANQVFVSTILFDHNYEVLHDCVPIEKVNDITNKEYFVRGTTALYDAIGKTIEDLDKKQLDNKILFVITTDGLENASRNYHKDQIKELIEGHKNIEFIFVGANIDSYYEAGRIGIKADYVANYETNKKGVNNLFKSISKATDCVCSCEALDATWKSDLKEYDN